MTMQEPQRGRGEEGLPCRVGDDCLGDLDSVMLVTVVPMMTMNYIADSAKGGEAKGYRLCGGNAKQLQSSWDLDRAERKKRPIWMMRSEAGVAWRQNRGGG